MPLGRDAYGRPTAAARVGRVVALCLGAVLVPAALILVVALAWYAVIRPLWWWLWNGSLPAPAAYGVTALLMVLLPLALFWLLTGAGRLASLGAERVRRARAERG